MPFDINVFAGDSSTTYNVQRKADETNSLRKTTRSGGSQHQPERESLSSFLENTTLHGARFLSTGNIFRRVLWSLALILCFSYGIYQVDYTVDAFYQRPFNTKITTKTPKKGEDLTFPAVTLCNFNHINFRKYTNDQRSKNISSEQIELKHHLFAKLLANSKDIFDEKSQQHPEFFRRLDESQMKYHYFTLYGYQLDEMLLPSPFESCIINNIPCGAKNFTSFISSVFGQCYTFNSGQDDVPVINATAAGNMYGLKLLLNVEREGYLEHSSSPYVGLKVLVHDQKTFPIMEQLAFDIHPGFRTVCGIKRKQVCKKRLTSLLGRAA